VNPQTLKVRPLVGSNLQSILCHCERSPPGGRSVAISSYPPFKGGNTRGVNLNPPPPVQVILNQVRKVRLLAEKSNCCPVTRPRLIAKLSLRGSEATKQSRFSTSSRTTLSCHPAQLYPVIPHNFILSSRTTLSCHPAQLYPVIPHSMRDPLPYPPPDVHPVQNVPPQTDIPAGKRHPNKKSPTKTHFSN
jgi:hypothetical protein